ncbi:DNA ligase 4 [Malania oleifera]|uniref:DNA ligase 4 n=1 Tax=Malania oleifera TaxID=397392 RepID=UPI0025AE27B5|nr:DNA ligase 4 [Malania oleifera]
MSDKTKFSVLCSLFDWVQRSKSSAKKRSKFRKYLDTFCRSGDYFSSIRLILPSLDRERGTYGLKESVLATCLIDALGMSRDSEDALRLISWRKGGAKTGANAGNFALVAAEVLQHRQGMASGGLTIMELNDLLDRLALSENRAEKTSVLSTLIKKTNALEMKWIVMIILKDLKLGVSEKSIFHEFHPDAEDLFNVTCDLRLVCEKLRDRSQRHKRQDIEVGKAVRPQLAMRVADVTAAWKKLHGKDMVVECKFDGDRIQIHKNGTKIHFFSRNFLDHFEYGHAMSDIIIQNILVDRCILDGEMLVWDAPLNRFAEFGSNQEIAKAAKDGLDSDRQVFFYVAFDILYAGDTSVIHQSLKERHELLQRVVKPLKGRLEILIPNGGLNAHCPSGEPCWSLIAHNMEDVQRFFKEAIENRDEGIVLKDLSSKWEPSDRSGKWLKLKPDYVHPSSDLDVLIIGGYYGSGRCGGEVAQFLVGLAERPTSDNYPRKFISFCRVGSGLSDEELDVVVTKLKPYFRKYDYPKKAPPSFYQVTNNSKERPDVWIDSPDKSIVLSITSDIRTIRSEVFSAPYSLRFPRIDRVRYDKHWHECLDVQSFVELVHSSNGTTQRGINHGSLQESKPKRMTSSRKGEKKDLSVPSHFIHTDVSGIKGETLIFSDMVFYFANVPPTHSLDFLHKMVVENGGAFSMNLNGSVTHCVAAESKGLKYKAAKLHGDVIHYSWVLDCCLQKKLLHLQPKYFLFLSDTSKKKLQEEVDEFSDSYFWDLDVADIKQLLSNIRRLEDSRMVDYYKKKHRPKGKWSCFLDCCIYFHPTAMYLNFDWEVPLEFSMKRMKLEVTMRGGKISDNIFHATHLVVFSVPGFDVDFESLFRSFSAAEQPLLCSKRLHVVGSQWLVDSLEKEQKLQEETYSLKPKDLEKSIIKECKHGLVFDAPRLDSFESHGQSSSRVKEVEHRRGKAAIEDQRNLVLSKREKERKRRMPTGGTTQKGRTGLSRARRTRARVGNKPAKIYENESDKSSASDDDAGENKMQRGESEFPEMEPRKSLETNDSKMIENSVSSQGRMTAENEIAEDTPLGEWLDQAGEIKVEGEYGCGDGGRPEKMESSVDPVQAMLIDMIPGLGVNNIETKTDPIQREKRELDPSAEPGKKKKVSYKDVAGELLKDW